MSDENKVPLLRDIEMSSMIAFAANARWINENDSGRFVRCTDVIGYLGPTNIDEVYAVPLPVLYVAKEDSSYFKFGMDDSYLPLRSRTGRSPCRMNQFDWEPFYTFPLPRDATIFAAREPSLQGGAENILPPFFGGQTPTFSQIMGATSSVIAAASGLVPLFANQFTSATLAALDSDGPPPDFFDRSIDTSSDVHAQQRII